ncbi:restriction endonuclease subunit S [Maribellus luteus]|uniref:Restriction endonuclease subunit S n=1 Tax=Maribellus luteus TaxID=2305463 RepID=A0A399STW9_9BACT|nr:restriction endonuclease subunit S [Maribellus luteus]RIJ46309.1 restriction endonuclease subunit S [Maribellus luteus]
MKKGWEIKTLNSVCDKTSNIKWQKSDDASYKYIDLSSVSRESLKITETTQINSLNAPSRAKKIVNEGDVIFATTRPTLKRVTLIPKEYDGQICSTGYTVLRAKSNKILPELIYYCLQTESFMERMETLQRGASYPAVTDMDVKKTQILLPPLPEQQQIVNILDQAFAAIDKAKANIERNLQNAKELFQSELNRVFSQRGEGWKEKTLMDVALEFGRGKSKHRPRNDAKLYGGKYPFVQTGDVRNANKHIRSYTQTYNEVGLAQSKLWSKGTICITIAANIAETAILDFDGCFPDSIIGLQVNPDKAITEFAYYALQFLKAKLQALGKGSAQDNINLGTFQSQYFPFPNIETQQDVVKKLDGLLNLSITLEEKYCNKIEQLDELKKSILQKAFTGEITASEYKLTDTEELDMVAEEKDN